MRIGAYLMAPHAISIAINQMQLSTLDIIKDFASNYRETKGFSRDRMSCHQISTDAHLEF